MNERAKARRDRAPLHNVLYNNALQRARQAGIEFDLTFDDIVVPEACPVLGITLKINDGHAGPCSPSLDRINPEIGYVRGNVQVISHRANTIKNDATIEDLRAVLAYMERGAQ